MNKVAFLDRDGVINRELGDYVFSPERFEFTEGLFPALRLLQEKGYQLIVITNQGGIAKGRYGHEAVEQTHAYMQAKLEEEGVQLTAIYYCPHHDTVSACLCRKPGSLMLEKAIARCKVDVSQSFMIGDNPRDVQAAEQVGLKGVLIKANENMLKIVKGQLHVG
jgi:D-glycero-D-manno-heptose 1,7-bisphosphate phosphatase